MTEVASRQLRNDTSGVLRRVRGGEEVTVTVGAEAGTDGSADTGGAATRS